jgi:Fic family protein
MTHSTDPMEGIVQRIRGEYLEMPGLRLTVRQATRFWGLDEHTCVRSLEYLVRVGFLARVGRDIYRLCEGRSAWPPDSTAVASM